MRWVRTQHNASRSLGALLAAIGLVVLLVATLQPADAVVGGGNEDCPAGSALVAKFEFQGGAYAFEEPAGNEAVVTITGAGPTGGSWSSTQAITAVVVKGGTSAFTTTYLGGATSGTFSNAGLDPVGSGSPPDISNVKFCGGGTTTTTTTTPTSTTTTSTTTTSTTTSTTTTVPETTTTIPETTTTSTTTTSTTTTVPEPTTTVPDTTTTTTTVPETTTTVPETTTTTTTVPGTTTTVVTTTVPATTTSAPTTQPATTTTLAGTTTTTVPATVLGTVVTPTTTGEVGGEQLPRTGGDSSAPALAGLALTLAGGLLWLSGSRQR